MARSGDPDRHDAIAQIAYPYRRAINVSISLLILGNFLSFQERTMKFASFTEGKCGLRHVRADGVI